MEDAIARQREHYSKKSGRMAGLSTIEKEHNHAISLLAGLALQYDWKRFLDVGAGSGRGMHHLQSRIPSAEIYGIEPVLALREQGHKAGISEDRLLDGDGLNIAFADDAFDVVYATGIMHHIPTPRKAITEMLRVAKNAVLINDLNNFGCGSLAQRCVSHTLHALNLWKAFQWVKNGGRMDMFSEGDGVYYSYSLFDEIGWLNRMGYSTHIFTTSATHGNPFWSSSHIALLIFVGQESGSAQAKAPHKVSVSARAFRDPLDESEE